MISIKNKSLVIILFVFTMTLLSLSVVSATDYKVSGTSFDDINNVVGSVSPNDSILLGNNNYVPGTIKTINVNTDNVTIKGQSSSSKATLNAQGSDLRILIVRGSNVRLENLIFINSDTDSIGSALYSSGANLTIVNCEFSNNRGYSGPILLENSSINVIIQDCIFSENIASPNTDVTGAAAAIDSHSSNGIFINCIFKNNFASKGGGALYFIFGSNNTVINCNFINNTALLGGAIWLSNNGTLLNIIGSNFTNNKATDGNGGAIYSINPITISNSNFDSNYAKNNGGAIYTTSSLSITGSNFKNNSAENGGVIYSTNVLTVDNSKFTGNNATNNGGAIYANSMINMNNVNFVGNSANDGGAIYSNGKLDIFNSTFSNNLANSSGGVIYCSANTNIVESDFKYNVADYGACIYSNTSLNISSSGFVHNSAKYYGGVIYSSNICNVNESSFNSNSARDGGCIYSTKILNINMGSFDSNIASNQGGAIYSSGIANIYGSKSKEILFTSNTAEMGSAIYSSNEINFFNRLKFVNNVAGGEKLRINSPLFINITYMANITVIFGSGDNFLNSTYSENILKINNVEQNLGTSSISGEDVYLYISSEKFSNKANDRGITTYKINTTDYTLGVHQLESVIMNRGLSPKLSAESAMSVTPEIHYEYITKKKHVKKYGRYASVKRYSKVNALVTTWYYVDVGDNTVKRIFYSNKYEIVKNPATLKNVWVKFTKKNKNVYRWYYNVKGYLHYDVINNTKIAVVNGKYKKPKSTITIENKKLKNYKVVRKTDWSNYLESSLDANVSNKKLKKLVKKLIKGKKTDEEKAMAIWRWNTNENNIYYPDKEYGGTRFGSDNLIKKSAKNRAGNCVDHANLAVAMFRIAGLPAKYCSKAGYLPQLKDNGDFVRKNGKIVYEKVVKGHAWAMVYYNKKWHHADTVQKDNWGKVQKRNITLNGKVYNNIIVKITNKPQKIKVKINGKVQTKLVTFNFVRLPISGQKTWLNCKIHNDEYNNSLTTFNYNGERSFQINGEWQYICQNVTIGNKVYPRYIYGFLKKGHTNYII